MTTTNYQEFAERVQTSVDTALMDDRVSGSAIMYCGSLFVTCDAWQADKICEQLKQDLACGVLVGKVGSEFTFDFVA